MSSHQPQRQTPTGRRSAIAASALFGALLALLGTNSALATGSTQVFAEFASAAGESGVREARLWVDGEEVTGAASVSAIRISYALPGDFPTGRHEARVVVIDSLGRSHEKVWTFEVSEDRPSLVAFFTDELLVELDALPRRTPLPRVRVSGQSLPDVEIELRLDGVVIGRTDTTPSGRFSMSVALEEGDNEIGVAATRPWTGEVGREARLRLKHAPFDAPDEKPVAQQPRLDAPNSPEGGELPGAENPGRTPRDPETVPRGGGRGGRDAPDPPEDREFPNDEVDAVVVITKPDDGDALRQDRVTVLGRAPADWSVRILVNGRDRGSDRANPAGHFTVPQVRLDAGGNELIAEAESPDGKTLISSEPVTVKAPDEALALAFASAPRRAQSVRGSSWRLEGRTAPGAELEVEVNGRLVMTERAGHDGRFVLQVPLERGLNRVVVEAFELGGLASERSRTFTLRRIGGVRGGEVRAPGLGAPPLVRKPLPGGAAPTRLRPLD